MLNIEQHSGIQMIANPHTTSGFTPSFLSKRETEPVRHLHMSLDDYAATPLVELSALARRSGVRSILVKDESQRFGLNAFKALGGLFALVRVICKHLGLDYRVITMDWLQEPEIQREEGRPARPRLGAAELRAEKGGQAHPRGNAS